MSFTLPTFNLSCKIWTRGAPPPAPPRLTVLGNLAFGRRANTLSSSGGFNNIALLLPAGTDIRDNFNVGLSDIVEVPAGTGRYYLVTEVDDAGKGFPNEHRVAALGKSAIVGPWPTPIP